MGIEVDLGVDFNLGASLELIVVMSLDLVLT